MCFVYLNEYEPRTGLSTTLNSFNRLIFIIYVGILMKKKTYLQGVGSVRTPPLFAVNFNLLIIHHPPKPNPSFI